ncbi:50S ribosomal protein L40e [Candidatus Woesearchaeota archaeon]|nr:50S ribosomal protein L40e [Candidatus Woesearchaeota archaeon]
MAKFPEAESRFLRNVFVCRRCKTKIRAPNLKVSQGKVSCRKCGRAVLRPVRKK